MRQSYRNNKERKLHLEKRGKIHCGFCRYNRGENLKKSDRKCWKHRTKARKQWEVGSRQSRENYEWEWFVYELPCRWVFANTKPRGGKKLKKLAVGEFPPRHKY